MRKSLLIGVLSIILYGAPVNAQNCTFISPSVEILNTQQQANGDCQITFTLSYDIKINAGNKFNFIHLWRSNLYPAFNYNNNGNNPPTNATALSSTVVNFAVDNNNGAPVLLASYGPDPTVNVQSPANNPFISITKTASTTAGADRFVIKNIIITIPTTLCGNSLVFRGDAWSSNSAAAGAKIQCSMTNFALGIIDPLVAGSCDNAAVPHTYSFNISTVSATNDVYYTVYLDNGNFLFDPANDVVINSITPANAITITPGTPFNSGALSYPTIQDSYTKRLFVAIGVVGQAYTINAAVFPCPQALAVSMGGFNVTRSRTGSLLKWTTESEDHFSGWEVQRKIDKDFEKVNFVAAKSLGAPASNGHRDYTFDDNMNISDRWVYYRLKLMNTNGSFSYSEIKKVYYDKTGRVIMVYPNPVVNHRTTVSLDNSFTKADVQVFNASGVQVNGIMNTGSKSVELNNLQSGFYIIKVTDKGSGATYSEKLVVQ